MPKKQISHRKTKKSLVNQSIIVGSVLLLGLVSFQTIMMKTSIGDNKSASATSYTRIWTNQDNTTVSACNYVSGRTYFLKVYGTKSTSRERNLAVIRLQNGRDLGPYHRWGNPVTYTYSTSSSAGSIKFYIIYGGAQRTIPFTSISTC
jgi:hypothetical protein